jgi:hypothetical protein
MVAVMCCASAIYPDRLPMRTIQTSSAARFSMVPSTARMTRKRLLVTAMLLVAIIVTLGVSVMLPTYPGVTKANFDRIEIGMHERDVEALFGELGFRGHRNRGDPFWNGIGYSVKVAVNNDSRVIDKEWREWERAPLQISRELLWKT